jgi:hypothetical protein
MRRCAFSLMLGQQRAGKQPLTSICGIVLPVQSSDLAFGFMLCMFYEDKDVLDCGNEEVLNLNSP